MEQNKKIYFVSDVHLGAPALNDNRSREQRFVKWLDTIKADAAEIFLLGDIFDFWYEYRKVAPRGFVRFLGKLAEITDSGIPVHFFTGNHDVWVFDYLPEETGVILHHKPYTTELFGKKFYMGHGDGLGNFDRGYLMLKWLFRNKTAQWLFSRLHPNFAMWLGHTWSKSSRLSKGIEGAGFMGEEKEEQVLWAKKVLSKEYFDYFVFGHRHLLLEYNLNSESKLYLLGDWIREYSYGVFDGEEFKLKRFLDESPKKEEI